jgi:hypothetical protein
MQELAAGVHAVVAQGYDAAIVVSSTLTLPTTDLARWRLPACLCVSSRAGPVTR